MLSTIKRSRTPEYSEYLGFYCTELPVARRTVSRVSRPSFP